MQPQQAAPEDYYQNIFIEVFGFVLGQYAALMPCEMRHSLQSFLHSCSDAQRLFARLLTRKGPVFFDTKLAYPEVSSSAHALEELTAAQLIGRCQPVPGDLLLERLTKQDITDVCCAGSKYVKALSKDSLKNEVLSRHTDQHLRTLIAEKMPWRTISQPRHWELVQLLYFGRAGQDWSAHVRRDLGQVTYETVALSKSRLSSSASFNSFLHERELRLRVYRLDDYPTLLPGLLAAFAQAPIGAQAEALRQRSLLRVGKWCEQRQYWEQALRAYALAHIPPARERRVRIHHKLGQRQQAQALLLQMGEQPLSATEQIFSQRFGRRGQAAPPTTTWLIEETPKYVEGYVLESLIEEGGWGMHCENTLVKTLTGLIYWQAIFTPLPGAFTNPFQVAPHDLMQHEFAQQRETLLKEIEKNTATDKGLIKQMQSIAAAKQGIANPLVSWGLLQSVGLDAWLEAIPLKWIRQLSHFLIRNLGDYRRGFPDLFIAHADGSAEFVEVKGPTDQLQPQQRAWFETFAALDIDARVIKLKL
ncbi:MAG: hypothetical protein GWP70_12165 [Proteobacteria bacterium]|nr:hypothetical protein [Pseudomonadota bacterium]